MECSVVLALAVVLALLLALFFWSRAAPGRPPRSAAFSPDRPGACGYNSPSARASLYAARAEAAALSARLR